MYYFCHSLIIPVWSVQVSQNEAARCALQCAYRTIVKDSQTRLSCITVEQRSAYTLLGLMSHTLKTRMVNVFY